MPPKKKATAKKENDGKDEKANIQQLLLEKDLEITTLLDKLSRLEKRSQSLVNLTEKQQIAAKEMEDKLQDVIAFLTSDVKDKEVKINELEVSLNNLREESNKAIDSLTRELNELKSTHKFVTEDLRLQLANAQVQLRDIDEFRARKTAIEQEIAGLKEALEREKKEHQDAMSDIERAALQEKERLKKEMVVRIEETKLQMLKQMDEQLHAKTKRTMVENEQLGKELAYHIRQTELILQKNEKLVQENIDLHRQVLLAKEVKGDLEHRNRMNQKSIRILLYKLREIYKEKAEKSIKEEETPSSNYVDNVVETEEKNNTSEPEIALTRNTDEAIRFLYACLEDMKTKKIADICRLEDGSSSDKMSSLLSSLDSAEQRQDFLMNLLQTAVTRQVVSKSHATQIDDCSFSISKCSLSQQAVSVDDILKLPVQNLHPNQLSTDRVPRNVISISSSVQTEGMDLEEKLALQIKERLQACFAV